MKDWLNKCHFGDVRAVLREMIADGVQVNTIVTSPPYWGLRSYLPADHPDKPFEIGSEPTLKEFVDGMVEVFDLARQVLRDDGTLWCNMGDSYARDMGKGGSGPSGKNADYSDSYTEANVGRRNTNNGLRFGGPGLKPKDLVGQPWRLAFALQDAGWWLRQDIVWHKPNPMPESTRDRCTKAHEYIFLLAKSERYYYDFEAMQEPVSGTANARRAALKQPDGWATHEGGHGSFHKDGREAGKTTRIYAGNGVGFGHGFDAQPKPRVVGAAVVEGAYGDGKGERMGRGAGWREQQTTPKTAERAVGGKNNPSYDLAMKQGELVSTRNRRSVWTVPSEPYKEAHFATFPRKLIEPCVQAGCPVGGTVLDIFFGSGTTGQVAQALGRNFIGIDINRANEPLQAERLRQPSLVLE